MRIRKQAARMMAMAMASSPPPQTLVNPQPIPTESHHRHQGMEEKREEIEVAEGLMGLEKSVEMPSKNELELAAKEEEEESRMALPRSVVRCRRADGKGWQCRREATVGSPYCAHHLAQVQSRRCPGRRKVQTKKVDEKPTKKKRRKIALPSGPHMPSELYYYYSGFGPSRRRESRGGGGEGGAEEEGEELEGVGDSDAECADCAVESDAMPILNGRAGGSEEAMRGEKQPKPSSPSVDA